jgi:hypothetical protein
VEEAPKEAELTENEHRVLPMVNEVTIDAHLKGIQALEIDRFGLKMASGGFDY